MPQLVNEESMPQPLMLVATEEAPPIFKSKGLSHLLEDPKSRLTNVSSSASLSSSSGCSSGSITDEDATDHSSEPSTDNSDTDESATPIIKIGKSSSCLTADRSDVTITTNISNKTSLSPLIKSKRALDAKFDTEDSTTSHGLTSAQATYQAKIHNEYNVVGDRTVWRNVIVFLILHLLAFQGLYLIYTKRLWGPWIFMWTYGFFGGLGITAGAHRLWSHRAYKARMPLRIFLMLCNCVAGQNDLYEWVRDHRVHHKFTETDADPHNSNRGFFFAHMGWLMTRKHPDVVKKGKTIDMSDILSDPVVRFQIRHYFKLYFAFAWIIPSFVVSYFWGVTWWEGMLVGGFFRYGLSLHCTWFVNSAAHMFGDQPYNPHIQPRENPFVSFGAFGEGFHNFHHSFPWDYKTSEMGWKLNPSAMFIDFMALIGQAYDLRYVKPQMIEQRKAKVAAQALKKTTEHMAYA